MSFLSFLLGEKKKTANVAKERLQIILAHERSSARAAKAPSASMSTRSAVRVPVASANTVSPSDGLWEGRIVRARPVWPISASR